jgi:hypothetical protein
MSEMSHVEEAFLEITQDIDLNYEGIRDLQSCEPTRLFLMDRLDTYLAEYTKNGMTLGMLSAEQAALLYPTLNRQLTADFESQTDLKKGDQIMAYGDASLLCFDSTKPVLGVGQTLLSQNIRIRGTATTVKVEPILTLESMQEMRQALEKVGGQQYSTNVDLFGLSLVVNNAWITQKAIDMPISHQMNVSVPLNYPGLKLMRVA